MCGILGVNITEKNDKTLNFCRSLMKVLGMMIE